MKKIEGKQGIYRRRMGDDRIYFRVDIEKKTTEVLLFEARGAIKRRNIRRLG